MWFSKPKGTSVALIDINSSSVAGGLVRIEDGKAPVLCYTVRIPFEIAPGAATDALTAGALRALEAVGGRLVREGAPALRAAVGEGSVDRVLVSLGSPWQEMNVATKVMQKDEPFVFTKSLAVGMLGPSEEASGKSLTRAVVATLLNGYLTASPYGKRAKRAEIVVLSTSLDTSIMSGVSEALRKAFHTRDVRYTSFLEPMYRALQELYPHEKDFLLVSVTDETTEALSVKRGYLIDAGFMSCGARAFSGDKACVDALSGMLREFAARHALPRTVFLLADGEAEGRVRGALDDSTLHALWLSDVPVSAISIQSSRFSATVKTRGLAEGDARLAILALCAGRDQEPQ